MAGPGQELAAAVRQAMAEAAGYLALVTRNNPLGTADALLSRPDTGAMLRQGLEQARQAAADLVQQAWYGAGASGEDETLGHLLRDTDRIFDALAHLTVAVRRAHASVPRRRFTPGATPPGENPAMAAAGERADAVRDAILAWARQAAHRARLAAGMAEGAGATAAVLAAALEREANGERLLKRWRARVESPACCFWCRRLHGVTIGLRESFLPYLGGPVAMPQSRTRRRVATPEGERRYGMPRGSKIIYTQPPRPYHGKLQGPPGHPECRCRLEIVQVSGTPDVPPDGPAALTGFLTAADVRDMPEDTYQADLAFLKAAAHELDQVLKRLAEGSA